jgi:N-acetylmuramoyl-L-alanine amidase
VFVLKRYWFLSGVTGVLSFFLLALPVKAGELDRVNFDENRNFLEFSTNDDVQPRAQFLTNPGRLVIELPGIQMGRSLPQDRLVGGTIQTIRFVQGAGSTQIVIELAPGYTMDAQSIQFRGLSPTQWTVQLPAPRRDTAAPIVAANPAANPATTPQRTPSINTARTTSRIAAQPPAATASTAPAAAPAAPSSSPLSIQGQYAQAETDARSQDNSVQVDGIEVTEEGVFIRTSGGSPDIDIDRARTRGLVEINIMEATLSPRLTQRIFSVGRSECATWAALASILKAAAIGGSRLLCRSENSLGQRRPHRQRHQPRTHPLIPVPTRPVPTRPVPTRQTHRDGCHCHRAPITHHSKH